MFNHTFKMARRSNPFHTDDGGITAFGLFFMIISIMLGGLAIDISNVMTARTRLQVAADAAAHAALVARETRSASEAKAIGIKVAKLNMPSDFFGDVLVSSDIEFGVWDVNSQDFIPDGNSRSAVYVSPRQTKDTGNAIPTYILKLVGLNEWNLRVRSIFATYHPTCFREGFVAQSVVDLQSNNSYSNGFCIHSNTYVSLNSNNYFEPGTIVSMPNSEDIDLPNSGFKTNDGLSEALRSGSYHIKILTRIDDIIAGLQERDPFYLPPYLKSTQTVTLNPLKAIDGTMLESGKIHKLTCNDGKSATISAGTTMNQVVIVTNCIVKFGQGVVLQDTIIATTSQDSKSMNAASSLQVGKDDQCSPGGGAQLVTMGGLYFPADLKVYGGQLLAKGNIQFAANADGVEGASFVSGGQISGTSNMAMGFCGAGMENNFHAEYFRMTH